MIKDSLGLPLSGATQESAAFYDKAVRELQCFIGDPVRSIDSAIAASPGFVMAHVFKGYLYAFATEHEKTAVVADCFAAAAALGGTERERGHVAALGHLATDRWHRASAVLEDVAISAPRDSVALQAGHQIDVFTGNARMLRDRIARALPAWDEKMPGYHAMLGMQCFGFEEMGEYGRAEALGKRAIEIEPRDGWAQHAMAHVMEMQSRQRDGIAWLRAYEEEWTKESFLQVHIWWHLSLYHYDLGEVSEVLALYDGPVYGSGSTKVVNMVDASASLWRLHLGGVDVGGRWAKLAENWAPRARAANYAFNDVHAMMAFVGAGRSDLVDTLLEAQRSAMEADGDNASFTRDVGYPVSLAIRAFGDGNFAETVRLLRPARAIAHRFGGSHAQRDVIDLTLVEAAFRGGDTALAVALSAERLVTRPDSPLSQLFVKRASAATA